MNAPTMANGAIYVGSDDHYVYSLDAQTGVLRWRFETGDVIRSSPTVTGGAVYVGSNDNHVYALDAGTGALLWEARHRRLGTVLPRGQRWEGLPWRAVGWGL